MAYLALAVALLCPAWVWWISRLWGLPDIGDPFDVKAAATVMLPEDENAYVDYKDTTQGLAGIATLDRDRLQTVEPWLAVDPEVRACVDQNQKVLDLWRRGTDRPGALYYQPTDVRYNTVLTVDVNLRTLVEMAGLRGSSLEAKGDMAGAWGWYRAMLRCGRHVGMHGCMAERLIGKKMHERAGSRVSHWASDPRTGADLLRQALRETIDIEAMTAPTSEAFKLEYMMYISEMNHPGGLPRMVQINSGNYPARSTGAKRSFGAWIMREIERSTTSMKSDPERARRVARLLFANWLGQCDRPERLRAKPATLAPLIYESDGSTSPSARALSPKELARWFESSSEIKATIMSPTKFLQQMDNERHDQARLIVALAEQLFVRERGKRPGSPKELVGPYLERLPEGYQDPATIAPSPGQ